MTTTYPSLQPVTLGQEVLLQKKSGLIEGKRIGLLANPTAVDHHFVHLRERLHAENGINLVRTFGPEHGFDAAAQDMAEVGPDQGLDQGSFSVQSIEHISLYGNEESSLKPQPDQLQDLDLLLVDIQDVGARYYTYQATMALVMEVAQHTGTEIIVLDRPNPINAQTVEGCLVHPHLKNFCAIHPIPQRHGMTLGELALYYQRYCGLDCKLTVVPMEGYRRDLYLDQSDAPWVLPSPNMPTLDTAIVYPGLCLLEGTLVSEGRGTTRPFEFFGAPYIQGKELANALHDLKLPGVIFRPTTFEPMFQKHAGQPCGGVQIHVTDRTAFEPYRVGITLLWVLRTLYGERFQWRTEKYEFRDDVPAIDLLTGKTEVREAIDAGRSLSEVYSIAIEDLATFKKQRESVLLY